MDRRLPKIMPAELETMRTMLGLSAEASWQEVEDAAAAVLSYFMRDPEPWPGLLGAKAFGAGWQAALKWKAKRA